MGKKEQLEELDKQMAEAKNKIKKANTGIISVIITAILGFVMPFLWIFTLIILVFAIIYYTTYNKKINEINYERAKLK